MLIYHTEQLGIQINEVVLKTTLTQMLKNMVEVARIYSAVSEDRNVTS